VLPGWAVVLAGLVGCSGPVAAALQVPAATQQHLREARFQEVTAVRGLPLGVRDALQALFDTVPDAPLRRGDGTPDIADPSARFAESGETSDPAVPSRRLVVAGCSAERCLVYYQRGGPEPSWHAALFHWTPTLTRFETGGLAPRGLASVDAVREALLSGAVTTPSRVW